MCTGCVCACVCVCHRDLGTFKVDLGLTKTLMESPAGQEVRVLLTHSYITSVCPQAPASCWLTYFNTARFTRSGTLVMLCVCVCVCMCVCTQVKKRGILMTGESGIFTPEDVAFVQDVSVTHTHTHTHTPVTPMHAPGIVPLHECNCATSQLASSACVCVCVYVYRLVLALS